MKIKQERLNFLISIVVIIAIIFTGFIFFSNYTVNIERKPQIPNTKTSCGIESCNGLEIACGQDVPTMCPEIYQVGDNCRQFVKCEIVQGQCTQTNNERFQQCKDCVQSCYDQYPDQPDMQNDCAFRCSQNDF